MNCWEERTGLCKFNGNLKRCFSRRSVKWLWVIHIKVPTQNLLLNITVPKRLAEHEYFREASLLFRVNLN